MSAQVGLFDSCLTDYVQACLQNGGQIVKNAKGVIGMVLCPQCNSEKDLRHAHEHGKFAGYECGCGHRFSRGIIYLTPARKYANIRASKRVARATNSDNPKPQPD